MPTGKKMKAEIEIKERLKILDEITRLNIDIIKMSSRPVVFIDDKFSKKELEDLTKRV